MNFFSEEIAQSLDTTTEQPTEDYITFVDGEALNTGLTVIVIVGGIIIALIVILKITKLLTEVIANIKNLFK